MKRDALPRPAGTALEARSRQQSAHLGWDAEVPLEGWAPIEPRPERGPWVSVVWLDSVLRQELEGTVRDGDGIEMPYRVNSLGLGVGVSRWGRASTIMARLDAHHQLVLGTTADAPGFRVPGEPPLGRGSVVVEGVPAGAPSWEAVAAAESRARARLEGPLAGQVAVSRVQALMVLPARWRVGGDGVIRWGPAAQQGLPGKARRTVESLTVGQRSPIVRVEGGTTPGAARWGWWQGVAEPLSGADGAHAVRLAVDVPSLAGAQAHARAFAWHVALANEDRTALWPTITLRRQLRRRLGDATLLRRYARQHLMRTDWLKALARAEAEAA